MQQRTPEPRSYPDAVRLVRRSSRDAAPGNTATLQDIECWLLGDAMQQSDLLTLFEDLVWRLVAARLPLDRASLHVGTLHPQLFGFAWNWARDDGLCDEVQVSEAALKSDSYRRNPLYRVIEHGETIVADCTDPAARERYPIVAGLSAQGYTEYIALPLRGGTGYHNAVTLATKRGGGFDAAARSSLDHICRLFALHVERHIASRIATNILEAYLGAAAGRKVLAGSIRRGSGEAIRAVIWMSDLRGFTTLTDRLPGPQMTALLNAYFERLAGAVIGKGGEVLKFIGDGLLAAFPLSAYPDGAAAAQAALSAAMGAQSAIAQINDTPPPELAAIDGWRPLRSGIALHEGEVFFGNVGAPERLDFTVMGRAVNEAARVESMSKELGRDILVTEPVARLLASPLDDLGKHALRGVGLPVGLFSPPADMGVKG